MKKIFYLTLLFINILFAQQAKYPYPIIFLHGLTSCDTTWTVTTTALGDSAKIFDVCLNHDGSNATASLSTTDAYPIGWRDGTSTPSPTRLYIMNYDNTRFSQSGHSTHTLSNQSAIMKQGVAIKAMINAILAIENTDKVILVGHSMGGLEIREYLQRGYDGTSGGRGTNWVDQTSPYGHRVIRVVTTGTPHGGSNHSGSALGQYLPGIDEHSEACRDLRYPYSIPVPPTSVPAPYLFGGVENLFVWNPAPYNYDVNCNGVSSSTVTGISNGTTYNSSMPLPTNIRYTYITSNFSGLNQDGLVETSRMWLYSGSTPTPASADTVLLNINHLDEPRNVASIIRGLDEPGDTAYAYTIPLGGLTKCFITYNTNFNAIDKDVFTVNATGNGTLTFKIVGAGSGIDSLIVSTASIELGRAGVTYDSSTVVVNNATNGTRYYVTIRGTATSTAWQHPYVFTTTLSAPNTSLSGTVNIGDGQAYTSLTRTGGLFEAINTHGLSDNLTAVVTSNLTEDGKFSLNQWTESGAGNYTLTIQPDGTTERLISGSVDSAYGMIRLNGADRVTIDGRFGGSGKYLKVKNTYGAGSVFSLLDGINNVLIRNCTIDGKDSAWLPVQPALIMIHATQTANSGITIMENILHDRNDGNFSSLNAIDARGDAGISNVTISQNEFINSANGIFVDSSFGNHWLINENSFYGTVTLHTINTILFTASPSSNDTISGNYIGGSAPLCGGNPCVIDRNIRCIYFYCPDGVNNLISNNTIQNIDGSAMGTDKRFDGIGFASGGIIRGNTIGHPTDSARGITFNMSIASDFTAIGSSADSTLNNTIANIYMYCETHLQQHNILESPATFTGISISSNASSVVVSNKIYSIGVTDYTSDMRLRGMVIGSAASLFNNIISFSLRDTTVDFSECVGLDIANFTRTPVNIFYNSIYLAGKVQQWKLSYCLHKIGYDSSIITVKNNIFYNEQYGPGNKSVIQIAELSNFTSDYNDFYSTHPDSLGSFDDGVTFVNFAGWKSGTGQDAHSSSVLPYFVSTNDLHLTGTSLGNMNFAGIPLAGISTDIDGDTRSPIHPYMGADENPANPLSQSYTIIAIASAGGTITPSDTVKVFEGNNQQFIITSNGNYKIDSVIVDGGKVDSTTSYTFKNVTANHTLRAFFSISIVTHNYTMSDKWNIVSIPLTVSDYTKTVLFPTSTSDAFAYENGYVAKTTLNNRIAYWLKFSGEQSVSMTGILRTTDTVNVNAGWNMIGTISSPVAVMNILSLTSGLELSTFFAYKNGYSTVDTLQPAQGYWVKANKSGQFLLSTISAVLTERNIRIQPTNELPPSPPIESYNNNTIIPNEFALQQNYPNPFNPSTVICYQLPVDSWVTLKIYNTLGKEVATLISGIQNAGYKSVRWDANSMPSGIYFYRLTAGTYVAQSKLVLMK